MTNSASALTGQAAVPPALPAKELKIDCNATPPGLSPCEKKQVCAKIEKVNQQAKAGKLRRPKRSRRQKKVARRRGNNAASTFKARLGASLSGKGKNGRILKGGPKTPASLKSKFMHDCAHEEWDNAGADPKMPGLSADHVHEIQLGGSPTSSRNLKMMSSKANEWMGSKLRKYKPEKGYNSVSGTCC
jgi:hypothetical protein